MISVVMAAYNASEFIAQAIESILNQTYREFELIIVDDGSTDDTLEISKRYCSQDSRIRIIQSNHLGVSNARNLGIRESKYPWIAIMDADDIAMPEKLEKQINATKENPKVVAWATYCCHINSCGEVLSYSKWGITNEDEFYNARAQGHLPSFCHPTILMNKEIFLKAGGYTAEFAQAEDLDLCDRMSEYGSLIAIPEALLHYRVHAKSASMEGFFSQKLITEFLVDRHQKKLVDPNAKLSFEEFLVQREQDSSLEKSKRYLMNLGMFLYRKSGLLYGEKQYFASIFYLLSSAILTPKYSISRACNQFLIPKISAIKKS